MDTAMETSQQNHDVDALDSNWGHTPICMDHPWVDTSLLPQSIDDIEVMLRQVSDNKLYVRVPGQTPGAGQPSRVSLGEPGTLEDRLKNDGIHILGLNLQDHNPDLRAFLDSFLDCIRPVVKHHTGISDIDASLGLFISCPGCVVPFHGDQEHNFLFQVRGTKSFHIFPSDDYELFPSEYREILAKTKKCVIPFKDEFQSKATTFTLTPGCSTYQPPLAPHWVGSDDDINISYAVSVYTPHEETTRRIHMVNGLLRKFSIEPSDVGTNATADSVKRVIGDSLITTKRLLRKTPEKSYFA